MTRKSIKVNNLSGSQYSANKNIRFKNPMLRLQLCDYILVKGKITVMALIQIIKEIQCQPLQTILHLGHAYKN